MSTQLQVGPQIVKWAESQEGKPYVWGGTGPNGYDCSGLCQSAYKSGGGITIPRVASAQQSAGKRIDVTELQPADLVFVGTPAVHVGMYAGNGEIVVADHTGVPVRTRSFDASEWTGGFRRMADIAGSVVSSTVSDILSLPGVSGLFGALEGVNAIAMHLTDSKWWDRIGKGAIALVLIIVGLAFLNRKHIENATVKTVQTGTKVAEVAAVA